MSNPIKITIVKCVEQGEQRWYEVRLTQFVGKICKNIIFVQAQSEDSAKSMAVMLKQTMQSASQVVLLESNVEVEYQ